MLMPSIFSRDLFDDMFDTRFYGRQQGDLMKTDVKETENEYKLSVDLPGVKKDDLKAQLKDGYLTISATVNQNNDEKDEEGRYIRPRTFQRVFQQKLLCGRRCIARRYQRQI